jgi:hypothetical protein
MKKTGITLWVIREHAIKSEGDWNAIAYIFENAEILKRYDRLEKVQNDLGERAEAVAYAHTHAGAIHLPVKELMPMEEFYYILTDNEGDLVQLQRRIEPYMRVSVQCGFRRTLPPCFQRWELRCRITALPFLKKYMLPRIKKRTERTHTLGKY